MQTVHFVDLLQMVDKVEGLEELSFITSQPCNTGTELFKTMAASPRIKKHLHLPFQSGSDRILGLMNRGYTQEKYLQLCRDYKKIVQGSLSTDIIVGFPTETDEDFASTLEVLRRVEFDCAYIFKYSPRPRSVSARLDDDVSRRTKEKRHRVLLDEQKKISALKRARSNKVKQ